MSAKTENPSLSTGGEGARQKSVLASPNSESVENGTPNESPSGVQTPASGYSNTDNGESDSILLSSKRTPIIDITKDLSALITQQMRATPDAIALEDETTTFSYAQLDERVTVLASLLRAHGVSRDKLVGVLLGRSANYVIACLAALRAGGAFLVLELAYPPNLLADVIDDAKPIVIITNATQASQIHAETPLIILDEAGLSRHEELDPSKELPELPAEADLDRLAFVSYSSGTTGRPKGIANPHRAPVTSYDLRFRLSDLSLGDRVACNVFFIWEILRPLLRGATVVCVPDEASYDPVALVDLLARKHVTETLMTPTLLAAVLSRHPDLQADLPGLRTLWFNGEVVTTDLARRAMKALPNVRLLNCYSASETHEIACGDIRDIIDYETPYCPVGPPLNENCYILDEHRQKVKSGVPGELFVGGALLARGYLNLPDTTAEAFLPNPFDSTPGSRMYRTGDLARMLPSGVMEITGRTGAMLKIRGYSVVPGKVETAIIEQLAVKQCAVIAHGEGLERELVAYIVKDKEEPGDRVMPIIDEAGYSLVARRTLSSSLPQYMIPSLWIELDELPTNRVSGKADLKKLPPPVVSISTIFNHTKTERDTTVKLDAIAEAWAASLNVPFTSVTKDYSFFDLGGHSLTLADLATRLTRTFGFPVPVARLVVNPTLNGHLETVRAIRDGHTAAVQADLPAILVADSMLPADIKNTGTPMCALSAAGTVLLTGATGFLGAFLLHELLQSTSARIICLVRFNNATEGDSSTAVARIRKNLLDLGLWQDTILDRIEVLAGNISQTRLGVAPNTYKELVASVQVIVHAAATVNLVYPYAALREANVTGTKEILRLASQSGATVQYVSTNGVLPPSPKPWSESSIIPVEDVPERLVDGYGQTKYVAEQLVHEAKQRGMPVRILRVGTISAHSTSGATNTYDLFTALIVESIKIGHFPDITGWRAEMTPVDYVSQAIISLSNNIQTTQSVFHIGDANPVETQTLFQHLTKLGYPTQPLEWKEWIALWTAKRGTAAKAADSTTAGILRGGMPPIEFLRDITILDDKETKPIVGDLRRPSIDINLLETYVRHWVARGWLSRSSTQARQSIGSLSVRKGALSGLVAVITGASSGIGAATAIALAKEGAHVAIAARRTKALESLKVKLAIHGGKVLVHQTDVTKKHEVESLVKATEETLGPVDILVSCAGVMYFTMMANVHTDEWERTVDVNCKGLLHCLSSTVPSMLSRGKGHIVAISSDAGRKVFPGLGVYSASKFFVEATLQALRVETAGTGLRVTSLQPGNVATELLAMSTDAEAIKKYGEPSGAKVLDAEDVAAAIVYAVRQPEHVAVNEIMIEPRDEPI